ncbi:hypothetical protein C8F04DRAFT_1174889 [Mycena alexandri]|uniref:Uncharacterized protein n=1 Tax=Mycena alexandri TaxID=1745969 RepID=A0AAD6TFX2_9AGAR|nr:hypothetical protein C8F04DRAFT_1174889 [Mycena alexandri]
MLPPTWPLPSTLCLQYLVSAPPPPAPSNAVQNATTAAAHTTKTMCTVSDVLAHAKENDPVAPPEPRPQHLQPLLPELLSDVDQCAYSPMRKQKRHEREAARVPSVKLTGWPSDGVTLPAWVKPEPGTRGIKVKPGERGVKIKLGERAVKIE